MVEDAATVVVGAADDEAAAAGLVEGIGVVVVTEPAEEVPPGDWKVATNGDSTGLGKTTGTLLIARVAAGVPSCTEVVPLASITWTIPAWRVPAQSVDPDDSVVAATQHGPVAVTVMRYELLMTG